MRGRIGRLVGVHALSHPHSRAVPCLLARSLLCSLKCSSELISGAFQLYDINGDGHITYDEMLQIVRSIYKMTGQMVRLPDDEDTPEKVGLDTSGS